MAMLADKLQAGRANCAPVAGKSTLNRPELNRAQAKRYHEIAQEIRRAAERGRTRNTTT